MAEKAAVELTCSSVTEDLRSCAPHHPTTTPLHAPSSSSSALLTDCGPLFTDMYPGLLLLFTLLAAGCHGKLVSEVPRRLLAVCLCQGSILKIRLAALVGHSDLTQELAIFFLTMASLMPNVCSPSWPSCLQK